MKDRKEQLAPHRKQIRECQEGHHRLLNLYQKNTGHLEKQLINLFSVIDTLGPRDIHNVVVKEVLALCPNRDRLVKNVARVLVTQAQTTTDEEIENLFIAKE